MTASPPPPSTMAAATQQAAAVAGSAPSTSPSLSTISIGSGLSLPMSVPTGSIALPLPQSAPSLASSTFRRPSLSGPNSQHSPSSHERFPMSPVDAILNHSLEESKPTGPVLGSSGLSTSGFQQYGPSYPIHNISSSSHNSTTSPLSTASSPQQLGSTEVNAALRMIRPRKSHIKSRKGCSNCKRRRIKCDEERPQCFNCIKHGVTCTYLTDNDGPDGRSPIKLEHRESNTLLNDIKPIPIVPTKPSPVVIESSATTRPNLMTQPLLASTHYSSPHTESTQAVPKSRRNTQLQTDPRDLGDTEFSRLNMGQLELLHHFLTVTAPTFTDITDGDLWLNQIPRMAFGHEFLMYAILTIASTHMRYLQDEQRQRESLLNGSTGSVKDITLTPEQQERDLYFEKAEVWYRQRALETFRAEIAGPRGPGKVEAMTVAGSLIAIQSFAFKDRADESIPEDESDELIVSVDRWLPILLGIRTVVHEMMNQHTGINLQSIFGIDFSSLGAVSTAAASAPAPSSTISSSTGPSDSPISSSPSSTATTVTTPVPSASTPSSITPASSSTSISCASKNRQTRPALADLSRLCTERFNSQPSELEIYMPGIYMLSQLVQAFRHMRPAELRKYVVTWPFLQSESFHNRLRNRDKLALIVYVHFLAVMNLLAAWWQEERVRVDVQIICRRYLNDQEWSPWLEWVTDVLPFPVF
ncbi:uncharacterized protein V1516DRAFT_677824 [Lipomyces oligophaga]|uniref:uncharacterized protein n=1 Tax=Lipomyces oligophaga TaxID=45792 RepID=UPI0034CFB4C4